MWRLAADENVSGYIVQALKRALPDVNIERVVDAGLLGVADPEILEWAATEDRITLSFDKATMIRFAYDRVAAGLKMPGLIVIKSGASYAGIIESVHIIIEVSSPQDLEGHVYHIPL